MSINSLILKTDGYKVGHYMQYPEGTEYVTSYISPRGGKYDEAVFFGLQAAIKKYLLTPITMADVEQAKTIVDGYLGPGIFNYEGWKGIVEDHNGYMPVTISAVPEGSVVPVKNALVTVTNTDPKYAWVTSYLETLLLNAVWYGTTVATQSYNIKQLIKGYLESNSDDVEGSLAFGLHDFGYRGASSDEAAGIGGAAHLINFLGTDTIAGMVTAIEFYRAESDEGPTALSVIASEHSTMCANADAETENDFASAEMMVSMLERRVRETGDFQIVSAVGDTYDIYRFAEQFIGTELRDRIAESGGRFVVRPDSGDPESVPIKVVEILMEKFGYEVNSKGYKSLPPYIRVLQGDGIDEETISRILQKADYMGIAAENFVFGMGGALLQRIDRDTMKFAMKASAIRVDGEWKPIFKNPVTDAGKASFKGKAVLVKNVLGAIETVDELNYLDESDTVLFEKVFENGLLLRDQSFGDIRTRAAEGSV